MVQRLAGRMFAAVSLSRPMAARWSQQAPVRFAPPNVVFRGGCKIFGFVPPSLRPSPQFGPRLEGGMASPMSSRGRDLTLPWQLGGSVARVPLLSAAFWRGTVATWVVVPGCLLFFHLRTPWPGASDRVPCLKPVQRRGPRVPLSQVSVRPAREYKSRAAQDRDSSPTTR
jgi:hypothetical protein